MADQSTPDTPNQAQDPARSYERAKPECEPGMGRLTIHPNTPTNSPDQIDSPVANEHTPRQINSEDVVDDRAQAAAEQPDNSVLPGPPPDHSMLEEEPDGWDLAPLNIPNPRDKRHPRTEGKGGTP